MGLSSEDHPVPPTAGRRCQMPRERIAACRHRRRAIASRPICRCKDARGATGAFAPTGGSARGTREFRVCRYSPRSSWARSASPGRTGRNLAGKPLIKVDQIHSESHFDILPATPVSGEDKDGSGPRGGSGGQSGAGSDSRGLRVLCGLRICHRAPDSSAGMC